MAFHPHVLTSPDRAAVVEENLHFISNGSMVTSAHMQSIYTIAKIFTNHWNDDSEMTTSAAR